MHKHGVETSEFYVALVAEIICAIELFWNVGIQNETINTVISIAGLVVIASVYSISRAVVKSSVK